MLIVNHQYEIKPLFCFGPWSVLLFEGTLKILATSRMRIGTLWKELHCMEERPREVRYLTTIDELKY